MEVRYTCPKHPHVVLFRDDPNRIGMIVLNDSPQKCPQCGKYYFKHECSQR